MEKRRKAKSKIDFESSLKELEKIASDLESGELGLEDSIKIFEKGMEHAKFCHEKLEEAERKITILQKGENGDVVQKQVKVKKDTGEIDDEEDLQGSLL